MSAWRRVGVTMKIKVGDEVIPQYEIGDLIKLNHPSSNIHGRVGKILSITFDWTNETYPVLYWVEGYEDIAWNEKFVTLVKKCDIIKEIESSKNWGF